MNRSTQAFSRLALAFALALVFAGGAQAGPLLGDTDSDGVDDVFDNCTNVVNSPGVGFEADQNDADSDGCGNRCDCDFDQSGLCTIADFNVYKACLGKNVPPASAPDPPAGPPTNLDATCTESDHDGSTVVTIADFNLFKARFGKTPGPSNSPLKDGVACP